MPSFVIRAQQEARLKEGARSAFLARVESHLVAAHPETVVGLDAGHLRQFVERHWESARAFGIVSERGLCTYLELACQLGEDFAERHEWAGEILKSADYEDKKLSGLQRKMAGMPPRETDGTTESTTPKEAPKNNSRNSKPPSRQ